MPSQKVNVRRIQNRQKLHVTFSKRRKGLFKKAKELAIMCKCKVAVIVFSAANKLTYYANPSLDEVIERRYHKGGEQQDPLDLDLLQEYEKLSRKYIEEERIVRQMEGLKLENLSVEHLNQLEERMENTLRLVKEKKKRVCCEDGVQQRRQQHQDQQQQQQQQRYHHHHQHQHHPHYQQQQQYNHHHHHHHQQQVGQELVLFPQQRAQPGLVPTAANNNEMDLDGTSLRLGLC